MKQNVIFYVIWGFILAILVGCGPAATPVPPTPTAEPAPQTIALVMKTLTNPFFIEMEKGARRAETELGINLLVKTGAQETSVEQQITIIEELIQSKEVAAIVIAPADSTALIPVLKKAQDAGIVIVNIDNQLNPEAMQQNGLVNVPFVSVDNQQGGYLSAKYLSDQITTPTEVIVLEGIRTAQNGQDRRDGALKAFAENSNITVVATETANWKIDEAYQVAAALFTEHPEVKAVFCANDMMALGVIQYLQENNKTEVMVAGYDALQEAKDAIKAGQLQATIDQQAAEQGYIGIKLAVQMLNKEKVELLTFVDVMLVTAENLP